MKLANGQVILFECSMEELDAASGIFDEQRDLELSNFQAADMIEIAYGSRGVYLHCNSLLSPEANTHNSELARANPGQTIDNASQYIVALVSQRRPLE